jgi:hypothetical protein
MQMGADGGSLGAISRKKTHASDFSFFFFPPRKLTKSGVAGPASQAGLSSSGTPHSAMSGK